MYYEIFHFQDDDTARAWSKDTWQLRYNLNQLHWVQHMQPDWQIWLNKVHIFIDIYGAINVPGDIRNAFNSYRQVSINIDPYPFPNPWDEEQQELIIQAQHPQFNNESFATKSLWIERVKYMFYVFGIRAVPRFLRDTVRNIQQETFRETPYPFIDKLMTEIELSYTLDVRFNRDLHPKLQWVCRVNQYFQKYGGDTIPFNVREFYNQIQDYFSEPPFHFQN